MKMPHFLILRLCLMGCFYGIDMGRAKAQVAAGEAGEAGESTVAKCLQQGEEAMQGARWQQALEAFSQAAALSPDSMEAWWGEANANQAIGNYPQEEKDLDEVVALTPKDAREYYFRGDAYGMLNSPQADKSAADLKTAVTMLGTDAFSVFLRAESLAQLHQFREAIKSFDEVARADPSSVTVFMGRGLCFHELREYDRAIADTDAAIQLKPDCADAFNNRGYSEAVQKKYDAAIKDYDEAIRLNPKQAVFFNNRANVHCFGTKKYEAALQDYSEAIRLRVDWPKTYLDRGIGYFRQRKYDLASQDFSEAIRLNPNAPGSFVLRASAEEVKDVKKAATTSIHDLDGVFRLIKDDKKAAIIDLNEAIRLDPNDTEAYVLRSIINRDLGNEAEAKRDEDTYKRLEAAATKPSP